MPSLIYAPVLYSPNYEPSLQDIFSPEVLSADDVIFWLGFLGVRAPASGDERVHAAHRTAPVYLEAKTIQLHL